MSRRRGGTRAVAEAASYAEALETGLDKLDQAERYQFGDKALKFCSDARAAFQVALSLAAGGDAEASYHLGRALFMLATVFEAAPTCVATMQSCVAAYRAALAVESTDETTFMLAQSLASLGDMISDGASYEKDGALMPWREAVHVFETTERLQTAQWDSGQEITPADAGPDPGYEVERVTRETMVETLLALIEVLTSLYGAMSDAGERVKTWNDLEGALSRAQAWDAGDANRSAGLIAQSQASAILARVEADFTPPQPPNVAALLSAVDTLEKVLSAEVGISEKPPSIESVTGLADARSITAEIMLRFSTCLSTEEANSVRAVGLEHLKQAFDSYGEVVDRLSASALHANHQVPTHLIPSTLSAVHSARSRLLLLLAISSPPLLESALEVAIKAVEAAGYGLTYRSTERSFTRSAQGREDWTTTKALREATLCMARAGFGDLGIIARLLKATGFRSEQLRAYVEDDLRDDAVWLASGGAEETMWNRVAGALEAEWDVAGQPKVVPGR